MPSPLEGGSPLLASSSSSDHTRPSRRTSGSSRKHRPPRGEKGGVRGMPDGQPSARAPRPKPLCPRQCVFRRVCIQQPLPRVRVIHVHADQHVR